MIKLFLILNVFGENLLNHYDGKDATFEILAMLLISAIFGFLFRHFIGFRKKEFIIEQEKSYGDSDSGDLSSQLARLTEEIDRLSTVCSRNPSMEDSEKNSLKSGTSNSKEKISHKILAQEEVRVEQKNDKAKVGNSKKDDLKVIEGIGPALEKMLNENNIFTYSHLANHSVAQLENMLDKAGPRFRVHVPETWPEQASLLRDGEIEAFKTLTERLKGGRRV
ncbi:MAG: hypothetical protein ACK5UE_10960 [Chitinophagales bacterium]|jgi:predicted flap endonuclease-1-like 5' DNA nuclease|nr:hypothetical protein [Sphingobacteriales bacterium]